MNGPIVEVAQGKLQGKTGLDYKGGVYYSFQGIPYAKPPLGELRFQAPVPPDTWTGVRDATIERSESLSRHFIIRKEIVGSEDCLYLNVYTPQLPSTDSALKPVMFWVHGGGFTMGSSKTECYGPEFLITGDVVLVTINYRLGILGFLSLEDPTLNVPGNAGMKDMVQALRWVQENIEKFGGNPKNVTIFGESAGAGAVHYLMLSPMGKGLFHRAILQSGCSLNPWACGSRVAIEAANVLGYKCDNEKDALQYLKSIPTEKFIEIQTKIKDTLQCNIIRPFSPVIEKATDEEAFLLEHPLDVIRSGNYNKVPVMIGYTSKEGLLTALSHMREFGDVQVISDLETRIPHYYQLPKGSDLSKQVATKIQKFYYKNAAPSKENLDAFFTLETDVLFWRGEYLTIKNHLTNLNQPIYLYKLSAETNLNFLKNIANLNYQGACHGDDIGYLFKTYVTPDIEPNSIENILLQRFVKFWTNFAKNADPNPKIPDPLINVTWKPVEQGKFNFLDINTELTAGVNPDFDRMEFWNGISSIPAINSKL